MNELKLPVWPGWETVRIIGRGSFGAVYEIRRDVFGDIEKAALKHISIPQSDSEVDALRYEGMDDLSITEAFRDQAREIVNEYKLMRRLNDCPTAVSCDDVKYVQHEGDFGWDVLIKMELLHPLASRMDADGTLPEAEVIRLGRDICNTLVYCSRFHILHRDIKPQNIMVSDAGLYKLGDFGIARAKAGSSTGTARIGTYDYMAPEVYFGGHYDASADLYSLGVVLYWLLNRRRTPFQPLDKVRMTADEKEAARQRRFRGEAIPAPVDGSPALQRIVLKACAFDPRDRYRNASDMLRALEALDASAAAEDEDETGLPPRPAPIPDPGPAAVPGKDDTTVTDNGQNRNLPHGEIPDGGTVVVPAPAAPVQKKKTRAPLVLAALLVLALLVGGAVYALNRPAPVRASASAPEVSEAPMSEPTPEPEIWTAPAYEWSDDHSTVRASRVCENDGRTETETVLTVSSSIQEPDCENPGLTRFSAVFTNSAFEAQEQDVPTSPALGHDWQEATYFAPKTCARCGATEGARLPGEVYTSSGLTYVLDGDTLTIFGDGTVEKLSGVIFDWSAKRDLLKTVVIEDGVTAIGESAFSFCGKLTAVTIPGSVHSIGTLAFLDCYKLTDIYYSGTQKQWNTVSISDFNYYLTSAAIHYNAS